MNNAEVSEMYIELKAESLDDGIAVEILESSIKTDGIGLIAIMDEVMNIFIEGIVKGGYSKEVAMEQLEAILYQKKIELILKETKRSVINE